MSHIWMSHVTHMNESCNSYEWVTSRIWMSHVTYMNASYHTHEQKIFHMWMRHVTQMNNHVTLMIESCRKNIGVVRLDIGTSDRVFSKHTYTHTQYWCHCNTLQHTATHCNTLQHTTTHYKTLQHTATGVLWLEIGTNDRVFSKHTYTRTHTVLMSLQHTAPHRNTLQHTATHCNTLQNTPTHCNRGRATRNWEERWGVQQKTEPPFWFSRP